jgi:hypothetical protein
MRDEVIVDAYVTCADCGKRQVDAAAVLARMVEKVNSAETFFDLVKARSHPNIKSIFGQTGPRSDDPYIVRLLGRHQYVRV